MDKILIVEDNPDSAEVLRDILVKEGYYCDIAATGKEAVLMVSTSRYSLILLDVMLPDISGFSLLEKFKAEAFTSMVPVILLTALDDTKSRIKGYNLGCSDFVSKPYNHFELIARVNNHIRLKNTLEDLEDTNNVLYTLAATIEAKDPYTRGHSQRVGKFSYLLAKELGWKESECVKIERAGLLHDIGKIGVPDYILTKPGKLTDEEFEVMKTHPVLSAQICKSLSRLRDVIPMIKHHHERIDGNGYPDRLAGENLPLGARIMAVVDAWDTMTSDRAYRKKMPEGKVFEILSSGAGSQWDRKIVEKFLKVKKNLF